MDLLPNVFTSMMMTFKNIIYLSFGFYVAGLLIGGLYLIYLNHNDNNSKHK